MHAFSVHSDENRLLSDLDDLDGGGADARQATRSDRRCTGQGVLGRDHASSGAAGFLLLAPELHHAIPALPAAPVPLAVGAVVSAGFALLPDIDEPGSTVSRKLGALSRGVSKATNELAGGHRQATHCLLFAALVYVLVRLAAVHPLAAAIVIGCAFLLVLRMLLPAHVQRAGVVTPLVLALAGSAAWWAFTDGAPSWLALAGAGGVVLHMIGDSITVEGVPWLWVPFVPPLQRLRVAVPLVGHTGSARESFVGTLLSLAVGYCLLSAVAIQLVHAHFPVVQVPSLPVI